MKVNFGSIEPGLFTSGTSTFNFRGELKPGAARDEANRDFSLKPIDSSVVALPLLAVSAKLTGAETTPIFAENFPSLACCDHPKKEAAITRSLQPAVVKLLIDVVGTRRCDKKPVVDSLYSNDMAHYAVRGGRIWWGVCDFAGACQVLRPLVTGINRV